MPTSRQFTAVKQLAHAYHTVLIWSCLARSKNFIETFNQSVVSSVSLD